MTVDRLANHIAPEPLEPVELQVAVPPTVPSSPTVLLAVVGGAWTWVAAAAIGAALGGAIAIYLDRRQILSGWWFRLPEGNHAIEVEIADREAPRTQDYFRVDVRAVVSASIARPKVVADLFFHNGELDLEALEEAVRKGTAAAIAAAVSQKTIAPERSGEDDRLLPGSLTLSSLQRDVENQGRPEGALGSYLQGLGLQFEGVLIAELEENNFYDPENYFDARVLRLRAEEIGQDSLQRRLGEIATEFEIEAAERTTHRQLLGLARELEAEKLENDKVLEERRLENRPLA